MRIALFSDFSLSQTTGISDSIRTLKRELKARGHEVKVFTPKSSKSDHDEDCIEISSIPLPGAPDFRVTWPFGVPASVSTFQPTIIHTHTFGSIGRLAVNAARRLKVPLVGTQHTLPAEYARYFLVDTALTRHLLCAHAANYYAKCDLITTPAQSVADELRHYNVKKEIHVISNPIETGIFRPLPNRAERKKKRGITKPAVLCFGRLAREKNLGELFEAFALARKKMDASMIVVGDGAERQVLQKKAEQLGIQNDVRFLGLLRSEELVEAINATDVYCITSRSETQSMTMLQSMACGLPVVAVDKGALPEIISHQKNGFIVASGDAESFASRLVELLSDASLRERMGNHGREYVLKLSPQSIAGQMEVAYEQACQIFLSSSSSHS